MTHLAWTPDQWTAVITAAAAALGSLIVSIITAIQHLRLQQTVSDQHQEVMATIAKSSPPAP